MVESVDPVMNKIDRRETLSDPYVREAYFGSPDTPGIISQAISAANRSYGQPAIMRQTAGLSPLEIAAMQGAYGGIGSYQPYLDANLSGLQEGIGMSRRAGELAQPYFAGEQDYLGAATDVARQAAGMQFDPNLTKQFYDPFENRVVQQTIDDVFKQGDIQDVAQRARDIQSGGESAFGSRARLTADERRASLGRGLGEALAGIRSGGFQRAQDSALGEFGRQQSALERSGSQLAGLGQTIGSGFDRFGAGQLGSSQLLAGQIRGLGSAAADRAAQEQAARFGAASSEIGIGSNLAGLSEQALQNAISESRFGRGALERAGSFEAGLGRDVQGARRGYSSDLLGIGGQRGNLARNISGDIRGISGDIGGLGQDIRGYGRAYGDLGQEYQRLGQGERSELMQYDQASRDMKQAGIDAQYTADERNRFAPTQAASYVQGFLPQYQSGSTSVNKTYGMPQDPYASGIGTFLGAYGSMNNTNSANPNPYTAAYDAYSQGQG